MIQVLKKLLLEKYEYELNEYALYEVKREKNIVVTVSLGIFAIFAVLFVLDASGLFPNFMSMGILLFLVLVLVIVPLAFRKGSKYETIYITPLHIIQRQGKKEFAVINFDKIIKFNLTKDGISIKDGKSAILIGMDLFREEVDAIIDILDAKGKTFDPEKKHMIRHKAVRVRNL